MSTSSSSLQSALVQSVEQGSRPLTREVSQDAPLRISLRRWSLSLRECWWKMKAMNTAFEESQSGDGTQSRRRSEERLRDEEAWARMGDEGGLDPESCPQKTQTSSGLTSRPGEDGLCVEPSAKSLTLAESRDELK